MEKVFVPTWRKYPYLGYFHYRTRITDKEIENNVNNQILPPLNPYLGFFAHHLLFNVNTTTRTVATQTDPCPELELGKQILRKMKK
tara:strand:- start:200 stop:457 length:258 start_codon:yes stop_codon:yes gene_type:complete